MILNRSFRHYVHYFYTDVVSVDEIMSNLCDWTSLPTATWACNTLPGGVTGLTRKRRNRLSKIMGVKCRLAFYFILFDLIWLYFWFNLCLLPWFGFFSGAWRSPDFFCVRQNEWLGDCRSDFKKQPSTWLTGSRWQEQVWSSQVMEVEPPAVGMWAGR